jgi:bacillithiol system protein YtxJ
MTATRLRALGTLDELESAVAGSRDRPLLLFKHSLTCGTSAYAREQIEGFLAGAAAPLDACVVHVQPHRALCDAIADRFGLRHESPQVLLVVNGHVVWHASHHRVSQHEIAAALERHRTSATDQAGASPTS